MAQVGCQWKRKYLSQLNKICINSLRLYVMWDMYTLTHHIYQQLSANCSYPHLPPTTIEEGLKLSYCARASSSSSIEGLCKYWLPLSLPAWRCDNSLHDPQSSAGQREDCARGDREMINCDFVAFIVNLKLLIGIWTSAESWVSNTTGK